MATGSHFAAMALAQWSRRWLASSYTRMGTCGSTRTEQIHIVALLSIDVDTVTPCYYDFMLD